MLYRILGIMLGIIVLGGMGAFAQTGGSAQNCPSGSSCATSCMDACTNTIIAGPAGSNIQACVDACTGIRSCLGAKGGSSKDAQFNLITAKTITYYGGTYSVGSNNDTYCMWFNGEINGEEVHMGCDYIGAANPADKAAGKNGAKFDEKDFCCGVKLNTDVPFVGRCINQLDGLEGNTQAGTATAFPRLMRALANIVMTLILVGSIVLLVVSGVMWTSGDAEQGKKMMRRVILSLVLLGASGIILRLINPVFFG